MSNLTNNDIVSGVKLGVLSDEDCGRIVETAYRILEEIGWKLTDDPDGEARDALASVGCRVDGDQVYFPRSVVEKALSTVPKECVIYDMNGDERMRVSAANTRSYLGSCVCAPNWMDLETRTRREGRLHDAYEAGLVGEALPNIDFVGGMTWHNDVPVEDLTGVYDARELIRTTNKPCWFNFNGKVDFPYLKEMLAAVSGGWEEFQKKPFFIFNVALNDVARSIEVCKEGLPAWLGGSVYAGATGPMSFIGSITQACAETLATITFQQAFAPGAPVLADIGIDIMNFITASYTSTTPELPLVNMATKDLFRYLNLPSTAHNGLSASPVLDAQAVMDYTVNMLTAKLSGIGLAYGYGFLEDINTASLEALVLANEMAGYLNHLTKGYVVDDETLAYDEIKAIGPGGMFMAEESTVLGVQDLWAPGLFTRESFEKFESEGSRDFSARANEWCRKVVAAGVQNPKSPEVLAKIDEVVARAEADFRARS